MPKPKVAIFDFACCEGCQLQVVNMEEALLDLLTIVDVVEWREAMSEKSETYDVAVIEGSITRPEDEEKIKKIRAKLQAEDELLPMLEAFNRALRRSGSSYGALLGRAAALQAVVAQPLKFPEMISRETGGLSYQSVD